ncbi:MAG TPA: hypothetical protein ENH89_19635 [Aurantimonas coralicida]|nr:hypothetical protein [Aurantimonas coralicida]
MALQLSQHAEAAIQRHKAVQGKKLKEEMERLADEKKNSGHVPRKPMDELMAEAKSARASPTPKE